MEWAAGHYFLYEILPASTVLEVSASSFVQYHWLIPHLSLSSLLHLGHEMCPRGLYLHDCPGDFTLCYHVTYLQRTSHAQFCSQALWTPMEWGNFSLAIFPRFPISASSLTHTNPHSCPSTSTCAMYNSYLYKHSVPSTQEKAEHSPLFSEVNSLKHPLAHIPGLSPRLCQHLAWFFPLLHWCLFLLSGLLISVFLAHWYSLFLMQKENVDVLSHLELFLCSKPFSIMCSRLRQ